MVLMMAYYAHDYSSTVWLKKNVSQALCVSALMLVPVNKIWL